MKKILIIMTYPGVLGLLVYISFLLNEIVPVDIDSFRKIHNWTITVKSIII